MNKHVHHSLYGGPCVLIECDQIPNKRDEIPTPEVTKHHPHLKNSEEAFQQSTNIAKF